MVKIALLTANLAGNDLHELDDNKGLKEWITQCGATYLLAGFQEDPGSDNDTLRQLRGVIPQQMAYKKTPQTATQWPIPRLAMSAIDFLLGVFAKWRTTNLYFFVNKERLADPVTRFRCRWSCGFYVRAIFKGANIVVFDDPELGDVVVVNTHLHYAGLKGLEVRERQLSDLLDYVSVFAQEKTGARLSDCVFVLMGDLNFRYFRTGKKDRRIPLDAGQAMSFFAGEGYRANDQIKKNHELYRFLNRDIKRREADDDVGLVMRRMRDAVMKEPHYITCRYRQDRQDWKQKPTPKNVQRVLALDKRGQARDPASCDQIIVIAPDGFEKTTVSTVIPMKNSDHLIKASVVDIHKKISLHSGKHRKTSSVVVPGR